MRERHEFERSHRDPLLEKWDRQEALAIKVGMALLFLAIMVGGVVGYNCGREYLRWIIEISDTQLRSTQENDNSSVLVIKEELPSLADLASLNPVGYYNGTVLITKMVVGEAVNIRTSPKITSTHPAESNVISWDQIISLAGTDIRGSNVFSVQNPVLVDGPNPTYDPGRFPSMWLAFPGYVLDVGKTNLYLNMSEATIRSGYVLPDTTFWNEKIVPFQAVDGNTPPLSIVTNLTEAYGGIEFDK